MKKILLLAVFSLMVGICSAYDFSAVSPSGHMLYYNIDGNNVKVVSEIVVDLGNDVYETLPTGDLIFPESVTHDNMTYTVATIGDCAFLNCRGLTSVSIPATVTTIESGALAGCSGIKNLVVPATVTTIESNAFRYVRHIEYNGPATDRSNWNALSLNGVVDGNLAYPDESKTRLNACLDTDNGTVTIPSSVKVIAGYAFVELSTLISIDVPNSVDSIGRGVFDGCENLVSATLPTHISMIDGYLFCDCKSLESFVVPDSVKKIRTLAFLNCRSLAEVTIGYSVEKIFGEAFRNCTNLRQIHALAPVAPELANGDPFSNVPKDEVVVNVPGGSLESYQTNWTCFSHFKEVWDPRYNAYDAQIDGIYYKFSGDEATVTYQQYQQAYQDETLIEKYISDYTGDIVIPETVEHDGVTYRVTAIGDHAFRGCRDVTSITIPESVTSIGGYAFRQTSLTSITIPESVKSIGECAFYGCESLSSVNIPEGVTTLPKALFYNCYSLPSVVVPESVDSIGPWAFYECRNLTSVNIPKGVECLDYSTFYDCSSLPSITIPEGVKSIGELAFNNCTSLTSIVIPKGVTSIGEAAFSNCTNLATVVFPETLVNIDDMAFNQCESLTSVVIPEGVTRIGNCAFQVCTSMTSITLPESLTTINERTFLGCENLSDIILPKTLTTIEWAAFSACVSLKAITIPESVTQLGYMVFEACSGLESIIVEEGNKVYDSRGNCNAIIETATNTLLRGCQNTIIPEDVTTINYGAFYKCYPLTSIVIPEGVTTMYDGAFQESGLTSVSIPSTMKYIDVCVFQDCTNLTNVYCYAENIPETKETTFMNVPLAAATLYVPESALDKYKTTAPWSQFGNILSLETPVDAVANDGPRAGSTVSYDLSGRLLPSPQRKGVHIVNGKKFMVQ